MDGVHIIYLRLLRPSAALLVHFVILYKITHTNLRVHTSNIIKYFLSTHKSDGNWNSGEISLNLIKMTKVYNIQQNLNHYEDYLL